MSYHDWLPPLLLVVSVATLATAYVLITRAFRRERDAALHEAAVSLPITTVWGYPGVSTWNANPLTMTDATTLRCTHMSVSGVTDASCTICGPLVSV